MLPPLIAPRVRPVAAAAVLVAALMFLALAAVSFHASLTSFDLAMFRIGDRLGARSHQVLLAFSVPVLDVALAAAVALSAATHRRWNLVVLAAVAPILSVVLTEDVLKPLIGRYSAAVVSGVVVSSGHAGSFPSGHETGVVSVALVVLVGAGQLRLRPAARTALVAALSIWCVLAGAGLVSNYLHYATDVIGAVGVSTVVVIGGALLLDRTQPPRRSARRRVSSPDARTRPSTSRAA